MRAFRQAIFDALVEYNPMTVRQVFYQLVAQAVIEKTEQMYNSVQTSLVTLRRQKVVRYDWISDNTRWMRKPRTYSSMQQMLRSSIKTYRRAIWDEQGVYVEIWCEKDALAGVILEETVSFDVPLMVSRGFASESYLYEAAQNIIEQDKPTYIYYFGDYDPSGLLIPKTIERKLKEFAGGVEIHFERVAVTPYQIESMKLPTRPTKTGGTHHNNFNGESVDLDAMPARELRRLVNDCITQHIDSGLYERTLAAEALEKETLLRIEAGWERLIA